VTPADIRYRDLVLRLRREVDTLSALIGVHEMNAGNIPTEAHVMDLRIVIEDVENAKRILRNAAVRG
jgi:hypothetical protein